MVKCCMYNLRHSVLRMLINSAMKLKMLAYSFYILMKKMTDTGGINKIHKTYILIICTMLANEFRIN